MMYKKKGQHSSKVIEGYLADEKYFLNVYCFFKSMRTPVV